MHIYTKYIVSHTPTKMSLCLQASGTCVLTLVMLAASAGMICNLVYLSIAIDKESLDDSKSSCPSYIRHWTIGLIVWCVWLILTSVSQRTSNDNSDASAAGACIQGLLALGTLGFAIAVPIIIDHDLRGVCPDTAYDEAFDVVFVYYVTLLSVLGVFGCAGCVGFGVLAKKEDDATPDSGFDGLRGTVGLAAPL